MVEKEKTVDFNKIEKFFKEYGGKPYNTGMSNEELPKSFKNEMKELDRQIAEKLENFEKATTKIACHDPSGKSAFKDYIWIRYKKENHKEDVYYIAVLLDLDKETNVLRIRVSTEINYQEIDKKKLSNQEKQKIDECYKKILKYQPPNFEIEEDKYGNKNIAKTILLNEKTSEQIINEIVLNLGKLEPAYDGIFSSGNIEPKQPLTGESKMPNDKTNFSLNQILYGPPGTGKTYNTVVKAMSIIHGKDYKYDYKTENYKYKDKDNKEGTITYKDLLKEYQNELKKEVTDSSKRIEFVTFHQSYFYEEFVEGIKPYIPKWNTTDNTDIKYVGKNGIFKEICNRANNVPFEVIYKEFKIQYPNNSTITWDKSKEYVISYNKEGSLVDDTKAHTSMPFDKLKILFEADKENNFSSATEMQKYAEKNNISTNGMPNSTFAAIKLMRNIHIPYVLIIDEINRGNISKIFGELITLIEEDKREGGDNALTVTLPYSQKPFSVPNNLYIIGTMNTADRSIALLDTALRRRFDFEKMPPDEKLLEDKIVKINSSIDINLKNVLTNINNNIVNKNIGDLDKNYKIGHAFFINVEQESKLKRAFLNKIYPLLEEYFYDDEDKIAEVLCCKDEKDEKGENLLKNIYKGDNWVKILKKLSEQKTQDDGK